MAPLLHDKGIKQFNILVIQESWFNTHNQSTFNPNSSDFYFVYRPKADTRTCFYINKRLDLGSCKMANDKKNLCSLKLILKDTQHSDKGRKV